MRAGCGADQLSASQQFHPRLVRAQHRWVWTWRTSRTVTRAAIATCVTQPVKEAGVLSAAATAFAYCGAPDLESGRDGRRRRRPVMIFRSVLRLGAAQSAVTRGSEPSPEEAVPRSRPRSLSRDSRSSPTPPQVTNPISHPPVCTRASSHVPPTCPPESPENKCFLERGISGVPGIRCPARRAIPLWPQPHPRTWRQHGVRLSPDR